MLGVEWDRSSNSYRNGYHYPAKFTWISRPNSQMLVYYLIRLRLFTVCHMVSNSLDITTLFYVVPL